MSVNCSSVLFPSSAFSISFRTSWHFACRITHQHSPSCNVIGTNTNCHCHTQHTASGCHPHSYSMVYEEATLVRNMHNPSTQLIHNMLSQQIQCQHNIPLYRDHVPHVGRLTDNRAMSTSRVESVLLVTQHTLPRKHAGYTQHVITNSTHTHNTCTEHK